MNLHNITSMIEKKPPTHMLTVTVPLDLSTEVHSKLDAVADCVNVVLRVSRAAYFGYICGDLQVTMKEPWPGESGEPKTP